MCNLKAFKTEYQGLKKALGYQKLFWGHKNAGLGYALIDAISKTLINQLMT